MVPLSISERALNYLAFPGETVQRGIQRESVYFYDYTSAKKYLSMWSLPYFEPKKVVVPHQRKVKAHQSNLLSVIIFF